MLLFDTDIYGKINENYQTDIEKATLRILMLFYKEEIDTLKNLTSFELRLITTMNLIYKSSFSTNFLMKCFESAQAILEEVEARESCMLKMENCFI